MSLAIAAAYSTRTVIAVGLIGLESGSTFTRSGGGDVADTGRCPGFDTARTAAFLCTHGCNTGACAEPAGGQPNPRRFHHRGIHACREKRECKGTVSGTANLSAGSPDIPLTWAMDKAWQSSVDTLADPHNPGTTVPTGSVGFAGRNFLIVAVGDSLSSGEGQPASTWSLPQCDQSLQVRLGQGRATTRGLRPAAGRRRHSPKTTRFTCWSSMRRWWRKLNSEEDLDALFRHRDFLARQRPDRTTSTTSDPLRAPEGVTEGS